MKRISMIIALAALVMMPVAASAATFKSGDTLDLTAADNVDGNLYAAGGMVSLGAGVSGDLFVAGGNMSLTGGVTDDLAAAGGNLTILGPVGGDLRAAGGSLVIGSTVDGELLVAGGNVVVLPDATVGGDAAFAAGAVTLKGNVAGDLEVRAREVRIDGTVAGNVHVVSESLTLGPQAVVKGALSFEGPREAVLETGAVVEGDNTYMFKAFPQKGWHEEKEVRFASLGKALAGVFFLFVLAKFFAFLLAALAAAGWYPRTSREIVERTLGNFGVDLLTGFAVMVAAPVAVLLLFATVVGWLFAFLLMLALGLACLIAGVFSLLSFGALLRKLFTKSKDYEVDWKTALLGTVTLTLVMLVPFVGWLVGCVFVTASFGSVLRLKYEHLREMR